MASTLKAIHNLSIAMGIEQGTEKGVLGIDTAKHGSGQCIACGKPATMWVNVANTF